MVERNLSSAYQVFDDLFGAQPYAWVYHQTALLTCSPFIGCYEHGVPYLWLLHKICCSLYMKKARNPSSMFGVLDLASH